MSGGANEGNFFNRKNLGLNVLTGGLYYPISRLAKNMKPEPPPSPLPPPATTPPPTANDQNPVLTAQQKASKLKQLQMGFATTLMKDSAFGNAPTATPGLKAKLGQ